MKFKQAGIRLRLVCGIAGILEAPGVKADRDLLLRMAGAIRHRGPDGVGLYWDRAFGMVNARLAIIDLEGGDQPIRNNDGRYWVMQNGEVYNAPELREELKALGAIFQTTCDTEVLVHAYEHWGPKALHRLNGAFVVAIWDRQKEELFLARDRLGIRPAFFTEHEGRFVFGSEAKAIFQDPRVPRALDRLGLMEVFSFWATRPDKSAFQGIRELPPGCYCTVRPGQPAEIHRWWQLDFAPIGETREASEAELAEELLAILSDSAALRLRAEVPVGAYLSGGLDSSATAALIKRNTQQTLRSFAVQFADPLFDESSYQHQMAEALGVELSSLRVTGAEIAEAFPEAIRMAEKPSLRTAPVPMYLLSGLVRESGFKVVLTGEGADEIFGGYNIFRENKVRRFWAKQPNSKARPALLRRLYPYLAKDLSKTGSFLFKFFERGLTDTEDPLYSHRIRMLNTSRLWRFLTPEALEAGRAEGDPAERLIRDLPEGFERLSGLSKAQTVEILSFLQGYLLHTQGDRMLMGHSVEGRFPFLDHRLAEFAAKVPDYYRIRGLTEKYLLRKAVGPLMPPIIAKREKRPYRAPILKSFIGDAAPDWVGELLGAEALSASGLFEPKRVAQLYNKCVKSLETGVSEGDEMALVGILSTQWLDRLFVQQAPVAPIATVTREVGEATVRIKS